MRVLKKFCCPLPPFLLSVTPPFAVRYPLFYKRAGVSAPWLSAWSEIHPLHKTGFYTLGYFRPLGAALMLPCNFTDITRKERVAYTAPALFPLLCISFLLFRGLALLALFRLLQPFRFSLKSGGLVWVLLPVCFYQKAYKGIEALRV